MIEQPLFRRQPATEPGERAVGADDTMAGEDDANGIGAVRRAERTSRRRDAERGGLPPVADRQAASWKRVPCRSSGISNVVREPAKYSSS